MSEILIGDELIDIRVSIRALIVDGGDYRFLLLRNKNGLLILPGGRIEDSEIEEYAGPAVPKVVRELRLAHLHGIVDIDTLSRELSEELGFTRNQIDILMSSPHKHIGNVSWGIDPRGKRSRVMAFDVIHAFAVSARDRLPINVDGQEIVDYLWLNPFEMLPYLDSIPENTKKALHGFGVTVSDPRQNLFFFGHSN